MGGDEAIIVTFVCRVSHCKRCLLEPSTDIEEGVDLEEVKEGERRRLPGSKKRRGRWKTLGRSRVVEAYSGFLHVS